MPRKKIVGFKSFGESELVSEMGKNPTGPDAGANPRTCPKWLKCFLVGHTDLYNEKM